jgi:hypothetical protein
MARARSHAFANSHGRLSSWTNLRFTNNRGVNSLACEHSKLTDL